MECPVHKVIKERKVVFLCVGHFERFRDLVIHLSKSKIERCPQCKRKLKFQTLNELRKHLKTCKDSEHRALLRQVSKEEGELVTRFPSDTSIGNQGLHVPARTTPLTHEPRQIIYLSESII